MRYTTGSGDEAMQPHKIPLYSLTDLSYGVIHFGLDRGYEGTHQNPSDTRNNQCNHQDAATQDGVFRTAASVLVRHLSHVSQLSPTVVMFIRVGHPLKDRAV